MVARLLQWQTAEMVQASFTRVCVTQGGRRNGLRTDFKPVLNALKQAKLVVIPVSFLVDWNALLRMKALFVNTAVCHLPRLEIGWQISP